VFVHYFKHPQAECPDHAVMPPVLVVLVGLPTLQQKADLHQLEAAAEVEGGARCSVT
jgi:hypothetical protein